MLYKDPEANLVKLMDWADKFADGEFPAQRAAVRAAIEDPNNAYYPYIRHIIRDVDPEVMKTTAVNFFINANLIGWPREEGRGKKNCARSIIATYLGPSCLTPPPPATCTVWAVGLPSTATS